MGFMDKVKAQADAAMVKAQAGMAQGQAKIDGVQAGRTQGELLRNLGAAYWAAQREGGSQADVDAAMAALDEFAAGRAGAPPPASPDIPAAPGPDMPVTPPPPADVPSMDLTDMPAADAPLAGGAMPPPPMPAS